MTVDSVFVLASLPTLLLQLAAARAFDIDAPVKRYLPAAAKSTTLARFG